jgi:hypothetical protein
VKTDAKGPRRDFGMLIEGPEAGVGRVPTDRQARKLRSRFLEQCHQLAAELRRLDGSPGDVSTRVRETCHEPIADWIGRGNHYHGDGIGRLFDSENLGHESRQDDCNLESHKIGCQIRESRDISVSEAPFDLEVLPLDVT